jgi:16S rRNA processing protein RimM
MSDKPLTLAAVTGAHGVSGEVRLKLFGEGVDALKAIAIFNEGTLTLRKIRSDNKGGAVARFAEVKDRTAAEKLRGTALSVSREALPTLDADEFYFSDLLDLAVVTDTGDAVGRVCAVENFGATDIVEIEKPDGKKFMVPLTRQAVPGWDERTLTIAEGFWDR